MLTRVEQPSPCYNVRGRDPDADGRSGSAPSARSGIRCARGEDEFLPHREVGDLTCVTRGTDEDKASVK